MKIPRPQFIVNAKGEKTAVIVSLTDYDEIIEDIHDLSVIAKRKKEKVIPYEDMKTKFFLKK